MRRGAGRPEFRGGLYRAGGGNLAPSLEGLFRICNAGTPAAQPHADHVASTPPPTPHSHSPRMQVVEWDADEETRPALAVDAGAGIKAPTRAPTWRALNNVEDHDESCVIDWRREPLASTARDYSVLFRPAYVVKSLNPASASKPDSTTQSKKGHVRVPLDRADATLDPEGKWMTTEGVRQYPLLTTGADDLGAIGGVGMRLYYFIVKSLGLLFLLAGLVSTPALYTYSRGGMYAHPSASRFADELGVQISLGSLYAADVDIDAGDVAELWIASCTNATITLGILIFAIRVGKQLEVIVRDVDEDTVTMSDYTVWVSPARDAEWSSYKVKPGADKERQAKRLLSALTTNLEKAVPGSEIAKINQKPAIWIAWDEDEQIRLWRKKLKLLLKLEAALKDFSLNGTSEQHSVLKRIEGVNQDLRQLNEGENKKWWVPVAAFVTFESDDCYTSALQLGKINIGEQQCIIRMAPEPETLIWAHLEYSARSRLVRTVLLNVATLSLLLAGALAVMQSNILKERLGYVDQCSDVFGSRAEILGYQNVCPGLTDDVHNATGLGSSGTLYRRSYGVLIDKVDIEEFPRISKIATAALPLGVVCQPSMSNTGSIEWPGWSANLTAGSTASCHRIDSTVPSVLWAGGDIDSMCYACICTQVNAVGNATADMAGYCALFNNDRDNAALWGMLATVLVNVVNQLLVKLIMVTSPMLKEHTRGAEMSSRSVRIFMCQLTNTAILVLMVKSSAGPFGDIPGEHYSNVNPKWYAYVASPMLLTMMIQVFTPSFVHLGNHYILGSVLRAIRRCRAKTQNQLNAALAPAPRDFASGYGEILLAMSVTLIYGPGIPVLYFVTAAGLGLRYCVEKFADLRIYRKPPLFSKALIGSFDTVMMTLVLLHSLMSGYLVAVAGGVHPAKSVDFTFTLGVRRPHVLPVMAMAILTILCFVFKVLSKISSIKSLLLTIPGTTFCLSSDKIVDSEDLLPFSQAYQQGLLGNEDDDYYMVALGQTKQQLPLTCPFLLPLTHLLLLCA